MPPHRQYDIELPSEREIGSLVVHQVVSFVKKRPVVTSFYFIGIIAAVFATGFSVTAEALHTYQNGMSHADHVTSTDLSRAWTEHRRAEHDYYNVKPWFWQSCNQQCQTAYTRLSIAEGRIAEVTARRDELMTAARQSVGIWSTLGVSDVRKSFWASWERGKEQAKRWTMMDAFLAVLPGNREEKLVTTILKLVFQYLVNLTVALLAACIYFMYSVYVLITAYGESLVSGLLFFFIVFCAGASFFASYIGAIFGVTAGGMYYVKKQADRQRIAGGAQRRPVGGRQHYD